MISKKDFMNVESIFMLSAIAQHAGKRKASEALNTSVDTINKYVDNLEQELGMKLLSSNGRGSSLTANGQKIVDKASRIKEILNDLYSVVPIDGEINGEVRIGMNLGVRSNVIPRDSGDFFNRYPGLSIISELTPDDPDMNDMSYDLGVTYDIPQGNDLVVLNSVDIKCGFFASPLYLSQHGYPIDITDMVENHRLVAKNKTTTWAKGWSDILKKSKHVCFRSNNPASLVEVIRYGVGIGVMPMRFKEEGFVCLDNIPCDVSMRFYLIGHKSTKDIPKIRLVIDYYKELMKKM